MKLIILFLIGLSATTARAWDSYKSMAKEFSAAAIKYNAGKIAVIPFSSQNDAGSPEGRIVADRLGTQLARIGRVELVERELLQRVMKEQYLAATGVLRKDGAAKNGGLLPVDAIVTGSVFSADGKLEIHARMIDVRSGRVLHAAIASVEDEWTRTVAVPSFQVAVPTIEVDAPDVFHDALADNSCDRAQARIDDLQRSVIETKAAYWANRMKAPDFSIAKLTHNPGSEIVNPALRSQFYELMKSAYYRGGAASLNQADLDRVAQVEEQVNEIVRRCNG